MMSPNQLPARLRFGPFAVNTSTGELLNGGTRIRLSGQPVAILLLLLQHSGEVVTREQLCAQIWGEGTFVDFEHGLNAAMNKLRRALGDSAENPRYIETVPGRGYRFIGTLEGTAPPEVPAPVTPPEVLSAPPAITATVPRARFVVGFAATACAIAALIVAQRFWTAPANANQWQFTQLTPDGGNSDSPAVSRDGKLLAYSQETDGMRDLYVKQIAGGQPIRLTFDGARNTAPDFSPDGSRIVFRSGRDGGGIFQVSALGGEATLLAHDGFDPRYSPDGGRIAFWVGDNSVLPSIPGNGTVWVIPSTGGRPIRVGTALTTARHPIWSPDGRNLLVIGYASNKLWDSSSLDWWVVSATGDAYARTGIRDALLAEGLESPGNDGYPVLKIANLLSLPDPGCWLAEPNRVIFSARSGDARNLWSTRISAEGKASGPIERLTTGSGNEANGACGSSETLVFARKTFAWNIVSLPFDLDRGKRTGPAVELTHQRSGVREVASLSGDGRRVAFSLLESGIMNVWVRDIPSGQETRLAPSPFVQRFPVIAPSGDPVAYSSYEEGNRILYVAGAGGVPEKVCEGCIRPSGWSRDGKKLLTFGGSPYTILLLDVASHRQTTLIAHPTYSLLLAHFSPDDRWVSFTARVKPNRAWIMIAPIDGPLPAPESSWIKVSEEDDAQDAGIWSPDGKTLYFTSERDGHICVWARRIDPGSHQPLGDAFPVQHFHEHPMQRLRLWSAAGGRIAVNLTDDTSSVWMMSRSRAR